MLQNSAERQRDYVQNAMVGSDEAYRYRRRCSGRRENFLYNNRADSNGDSTVRNTTQPILKHQFVAMDGAFCRLPSRDLLGIERHLVGRINIDLDIDSR